MMPQSEFRYSNEAGAARRTDRFEYSREESALNACLFNPIMYCCFKHLNFYVCQRFEFDAVSRDARLAESLPKCLGQVLSVI